MSAQGTFRQRLTQAVAAVDSNLCVGIDPPVTGLSPFFQSALTELGAGGFLEAFATMLIEAASGLAPAVKFQSAFFEAYGEDGVRALRVSMARARAAGLLTILDAKRGDISSTMSAYGHMAFTTMQADILTVTPYMGWDVIAPLAPWLKDGCGVYIVWISSNAGGTLLQDLAAWPLLREFTERSAESGLQDAIGLVLGATKVSALPSPVPAILRHYPLLLPGVGAQGGEVSPQQLAQLGALQTALVPQSRSLVPTDPLLKTWSVATVAARQLVATQAAAFRPKVTGMTRG